MQHMLEVGDRAVDAWEDGLEVSENVRGRVRGLGRQLGRRAQPRECRADLALALLEPFPNSLQGPVAEMAIGGADGCEDAAGGGPLEKTPQTAGGQAEPSNFVGGPDAEGPPATGPGLAVAAKDAAGADRLALRTAVIKAVQRAMPNQGTDDLAMRTRRQLEPLGPRV